MLVVLAAVALAMAGSARPQEEAPDSDPYAELGTWVDIYDGGLYRNPAAAVRGMKRRGVRTLYIETANYRQPVDIVKPRAVVASSSRRMPPGFRSSRGTCPGSRHTPAICGDRWPPCGSRRRAGSASTRSGSTSRARICAT